MDPLFYFAYKFELFFEKIGKTNPFVHDKIERVHLPIKG